MGRRAIMSRMPQETRSAIADLYRSGASDAAIHRDLVERGVEIALSTVRAWRRRLDRETAEARRLRVAADDKIDRLLAGSRGAELGRLNVEIVQGLVLDLLGGDRGRGLGPRELAELGQTLRLLAGAGKDIAAVGAVDAAARAEAGVRAAGASAATVARIRREVYGLPG